MDQTNQSKEAIEGALQSASMMDHYMQGLFSPPGIFFELPIITLFFIAALLIVERLYKVLFIYNADASILMSKVQRLVMDNNIDEAVKVASKRKNAAIYEVFKAALVNADRPIEEIQDHIEVAKLGIVPKLQKRIPYLFTIANVATLLGLLGTVIGLIEIFGRLPGVENAQEKQDILTSGIATALGATASGLAVAIPSMACYGYLINRINNILDEVEHYSGKLLILLRTGSDYFEKFSTDEMVSTEQNPRKAQTDDITDEIDTRVRKAGLSKPSKYGHEGDEDSKDRKKA